MIPKKKPATTEQIRDNNEPYRVGRKQAPEPETPASKTGISSKKIRLSADIDHVSYIKIKLFCATKRKSIVSLVTGWIDTYCTL